MRMTTRSLLPLFSLPVLLAGCGAEARHNRAHLALTGEQRVEVRGTVPDLTALPASGGTYWLELDFSGMRTSVNGTPQ